jgi:deoxyribonuclease V
MMTDRPSSLSHPWQVTSRQAIAIQEELREKVVLTDRLDQIQYVAGADAGLSGMEKTIRAAAVLLRFPELDPVSSAVVDLPAGFPYVPGLLSFREAPAIICAIKKLDKPPDLLLCDGQGIAHPRRFGIACHLGVLLDLPAIGVAKKRLCGTHEEPGYEKGSYAQLTEKGEIVGAVLRSRSGVKPLYVSPGHRISLETSLYYVTHCLTRFRLPETTRQAHRLASREKPVR